MHFLGCLDVPAIATFRDSPVYTDAVESGRGVVDMRDYRAARKETPAWRGLVEWIEEQPKVGEAPAPGSSPQQARRHPRLDATSTTDLNVS